MLPLAKVCDAADWFDPSLLRVVRDELRERPRFHRKQWEFAFVFLALERLGLLRPSCEGLALGGGRERLLYAVAPRVRRLLVTDLYAPDSTWQESRTADPDSYVRAGAPFAADLSALQVRRMDMRALELPEESFDFAYSCCAIEHIGAEEDFARHLREVHRVLRPGGAYVLTTELNYGRDTLADPGNFVFGVDALRALLAGSPFRPEPACAAALVPHRANFPLPEDVGQLFAAGAVSGLLSELPHVQLLRGALPHTSAAIVLHKRPLGPSVEVAFPGLEDAQRFLAEGVAEYRHWLENSALPMAPWAYLGGDPPCAGEEDGGPLLEPGASLFHTRYAWLGGGRRVFAARVRAAAAGARLELRVHRQPTAGCGLVEPAGTACADLSDTPVEAQVVVDVDPDSSYAFLGTLALGTCRLRAVSVEIGPGGRSTPPA